MTTLSSLSALSLKQLLDAHQVPVNKGALAQVCDDYYQQLNQTVRAEQPTPVGVMSHVIRSLQLVGVQPAQLNWQRFDQRRLPALVCIDALWWLVERGENSLLLLTDEAGATRHCESTHLDSCPVLCIRVQRATDTPSVFSLKDNIAARMVLREVFRTRTWLRDIAVATVIINVLAIATSLFAMQVYDRVVPTLAYATLWTLVTIMGIVVALDWLLKNLRARVLDSLSTAVDKAVSQQVFDHILSLQLDTRPRSLGTLAAQVAGLDSARQFFTSGIVFSLVDLPFALMFLVFILIIGGPIAYVYALLFPIAAALGWITRQRLRRLLSEQMIRSNERQGLLVETLQGAESVQSDYAGWRFSEKWQDISQTIARYGVVQRAISNRATITTASLSTVAYVSALVVGVHQIEVGNLTMGSLIACSILGGRIIAPATQSVQYLVQWQNVVQALSMVNQVLQLPASRRADQQLLMPQLEQPKITLEQLQFAYPNSMIQQLAIEQLRFQAGERVVLLGPVGSGKSTLLKVLAGLYKPSHGRLVLGDAELWEIDPQLLADWIGYLPQNVDLFKGSLRSNLCLSGTANDAHLLAVCAELGIDRIAAGSHLGMDLPINEGGTGLSGGQKQLVGLARIFLNAPKIWLLDEPTASLDANTEKQVLDAIQQRIKPHDIVIIATHKPKIARLMATRVIVMEQGAVHDDGKMDDVLQRLLNQVQPGNSAAAIAKAGLSRGNYTPLGKNHVV